MVAAIATWPQFFKLEQTYPIAQIVSLRPLLVLACAGVLVVALLLALIRPLRGFAASIAIIALIAGLTNAGILASRGLATDTLPAKTSASVRVLSWNTEGGAADPNQIARTAVQTQADIVSLPETTIETGKQVAIAMRKLGHPMWAHHEKFTGWDANSTTLLISPSLGDYAVVDSAAAGADNTSIVPSVVAMPVKGNGPIVVAVHAVAPRPDTIADWRRDLTWIANQCASKNVIMAGDFNATLDHMAPLGTHGGVMGDCADAASHAGTGGIGTWSTAWPALLGTTIDHVMATGMWKASGSAVLTDLDGTGSDHRPIVVQLDPTR